MTVRASGEHVDGMQTKIQKLDENTTTVGGRVEPWAASWWSDDTGGRGGLSPVVRAPTCSQSPPIRPRALSPRPSDPVL